MDRILTPAEEAELDGRISEHSQKNSHPNYIVVPFLLYNLPEEKRWVFADELPESVKQELVPKVWRPQWDAMTPFLLDQ